MRNFITTKKLEITYIELMNKGKKLFKVTMRSPELMVSETYIFYNQSEAIKKFLELIG